jgi:alpha-L-fucosidase
MNPLLPISPALAAALMILLPIQQSAAAGEASAVPLTTPEPALASDPGVHIAEGPFKPTWDSLAAGYKCPEWFRDAKFGMWAHWTAQCVPEMGDWFARQMYQEGSRDYEYSLKTHGPQSKFGFKDYDNLWKAEHWDPDKLMALYKRAGAHYFMALANHHDNFDCYDSKYQPWNSTKVGPMKDIVGIWAEVARKNGLRFGVSNHSSHAWHWFQVAYGYDTEGPYKDIPYDGWLTKADGKGQWWEGLDPQDLYCGPRYAPPKGLDKAAYNQWFKQHDRWHEEIPPMDNGYSEKWFLRCQDLVDKYHPDLLYFDDASLPLEQYGLDIAAHFYNANASWHGGDNQAVINAKGLSPEHRPALVEDYERGSSDIIQPAPWQTDTCIGNWHYQKGIKYKTVALVTQMLANIVSKNGNLMLNIPLRGDGTIDDDELAFLNGLAKWMDVEKEGIFDTRPWKIYGEGPVAKGGMFNENKIKYGAGDIRFTSKGDNTLYAYFLGWPADGKLTIRSLSKGANPAGPLDKNIASLTLLGSTEKIAYTQDADGLHVTLPATAPAEGACALKLTLD